MGGYFTAVAGATITAANANTYIRDQTVNQFASVSARDSAITSPVNGMVCTTTDTGYLWRHNGAKWMVLPFEVLMTTSHSWTSTTTFTLVNNSDTLPTGGVQWSVDANSRYTWELDMHIQAAAGIGLSAQMLYPTGGSADTGYVGSNNAGNFSTGGTQGIASAATIGTWGGTGGTSYTRLHGQLTTAGTSGVVQFGFTQGSSNATASFLLIGTVLRVRQVG